MFKAAKAGPQKAITANDLLDGRVVFLGPGQAWVTSIDSAELFSDGPGLDAAVAFAREQHEARVIVEPYPIDIEIVDGRALPVRIRERIRALGPTVPYGTEEFAALEGRRRLAEAAE